MLILLLSVLWVFAEPTSGAGWKDGYMGPVARGEPVRNEGNIAFAIDDKSISVNGGDGIIDFIEYIVSGESDTFAGFKVGLYGDKISVDFPESSMNLVDTEGIHHRAPLIENITESLRDSFEEIVSNVEDGGDARAVSLMEVSNAMTREDLKRIFVSDRLSDSAVDLDSDSDGFKVNNFCHGPDIIDSYHAEHSATIGSDEPVNQMIAESYIMGKNLKYETDRYLLNDSITGDQLSADKPFGGLLSVVLIALLASSQVRYHPFPFHNVNIIVHLKNPIDCTLTVVVHHCLSRCHRVDRVLIFVI